MKLEQIRALAQDLNAALAALEVAEQPQTLKGAWRTPPKLTPTQADQLRRRRKTGESFDTIGADFGVSGSSAWRYCKQPDFLTQWLEDGHAFTFRALLAGYEEAGIKPPHDKDLSVMLRSAGFTRTQIDLADGGTKTYWHRADQPFLRKTCA
jgi:hypothetical protein